VESPGCCWAIELVDHSAVKLMDPSAVELVDHTAVKLVDHSAVELMDHSAVKLMDHSAVELVDHSACKCCCFAVKCSIMLKRLSITSICIAYTSWILLRFPEFAGGIKFTQSVQ
jgi:hypothetical protein